MAFSVGLCALPGKGAESVSDAKRRQAMKTARIRAFRKLSPRGQSAYLRLLIAGFEGYSCNTETGAWSDPDGKLASLPDYPHDLNATMHAARRLPRGLYLEVQYPFPEREGEEAYAGVRKSGSQYFLIGKRASDPARAAFDALSAYLADQGHGR